MSLKLVDLRCDGADKRSWRPLFDWSIGYEHPHWWDNANGTIGDPWFVQVLEDGAEVAQVQLDDRGGANPTYADVPEAGPRPWLKIQFIEVATAGRRRKIGTRVVQGLAERHPDRRLLAYSEGRDDFWSSLDWDPFYDSRPGPSGQTLFIQRYH